MANITNEFIDSRECATVNEAELNSVDSRIQMFEAYVNGYLPANIKEEMTVDKTLEVLDYFLYVDDINYDEVDKIATNG